MAILNVLFSYLMAKYFIILPIFITFIGYALYATFLVASQASAVKEKHHPIINIKFLKSIQNIESGHLLDIQNAIEFCSKNNKQYELQETLLNYMQNPLSLTEKNFQIAVICYLYYLDKQLTGLGASLALNGFSILACLLFIDNSENKQFVNQLLQSYFSKKSQNFKEVMMETILSSLDDCYLLVIPDKKHLMFFVRAVYLWVHNEQPPQSVVDKGVF